MNGQRLYSCGTRAVVKVKALDFRVVCATCDGGGTISYETAAKALTAAVRDSSRPCPVRCGAHL